MQVNITFRHLEPTEALKDHVKDKVAHIQRYIDRLITDYMPLAGDRAFGEGSEPFRTRALGAVDQLVADGRALRLRIAGEDRGRLIGGEERVEFRGLLVSGKFERSCSSRFR